MRQTRRRTQAGLTPGKDDNEVWHNSCRNRLKVSMGVQYQRLRKDLQSVHWSSVGLYSWVPTRILFREQ